MTTTLSVEGSSLSTIPTASVWGGLSNSQKFRKTMNMKSYKDQYEFLKSKHPNAILLFRCGDFYESYFDDAKKVSEILGITLTRRKGESMYMTGFPYHALDTYLPKLIRAGLRVAICDELEAPKGGNSNNNNNNQNSTTMANKNFKVADLIGKVLVIGNNAAKYVIVSAIDDEKVNTVFKRDGMPDLSMPMAIASIREMLNKNMAHFEGESAAETADAPKQEQPKAEQPKKVRIREKSKPKTEQPAANFEDVDEDAPEQPAEAPKPKTEQPKAEQPKTAKAKTAKGASKGKYVFAAYTTKSGKTGGKILGFDPEDEIYQAGMQFHASKTWERKNGKRIYALIFGPRYKDCAEAICEALNSGAGLDEVIAIADNTTEQNAQERAEKKAEYFAKKAERAERAKEKAAEAQGSTASTGSKGAGKKTERLYTEAEVKERIRKAFAALASAAGIKLEDLEPLIQAA